MNKFIQLHLLTSYPPANLNRDDLGRPKTAMMGGANRLRISSQSLKRAWRKSETFEMALAGHVGTRTKDMGRKVYKDLVEKGVPEKKAIEWSNVIAGIFGKLKKLTDSEKKKRVKALEENGMTALAIEREIKLIHLEIEQLSHFSPEEIHAIDSLIEEIAGSGDAPTEKQLELLRKKHTAVDIALFGRMLASSPAYNTEAAAQVAHAISTHKVTVEDDYFTAVDDLNSGEEDMGAAHIGETEFAAGLFYLYICIDREMLAANLSDNAELAAKTISALIQSATTIAPSGKQNSFASRARASYVLCESGNQQPRSLSVAFLKPIGGSDLLSHSIEALVQTRQKMDAVYGDGADRIATLNAITGEGSLQEIIDCATGA